MRDPAHITELLVAWNRGDEKSLEELIPAVEQELRRIAHRYMRRENPGHTLQTTALVNEAYLKLVDQTRVSWQNRAHFFAIAAQVMRRILINHARDRRAAKRGGDAAHLNLDDVFVLSEEKADELIALDDALERLAKIDARRGKIVEMRFFGGLSIEETAHVLKVAQSTVSQDWRLARAWLHAEIQTGYGEMRG
jgi:RNA polymerase sigma factor (TIGR02999 family)